MNALSEGRRPLGTFKVHALRLTRIVNKFFFYACASLRLVNGQETIGCELIVARADDILCLD